MPTSKPENRLLAALPPSVFTRLTARMTDVTVAHKETVFLHGDTIKHVYFPKAGILSAVVVMLDGQSAEVALVGYEGMVGVSTYLGAIKSTEHVFCQLAPCECRRLPVSEFVAEVARKGPFQDLIYGYIRAALVATSRQTACNALHSVDERCARWMLMCHDRARADEFALTHEFLATMLCVRRATVSVTAASLQSAGILSYRHGRVKILDREALEEATCECYAAIRDSFEIAK